MPDNESKALVDLQDFIVRSERKNSFNYIKDLVKIGLDTAAEELKERRIHLGKMLEEEARNYEKEFALQVKHRLEENLGIQNRAIIRDIREVNEIERRKLLEKKNLQRNYENCHEVREAVRQLEMKHLKESQLEQIVEKERAMRRECALNKAWYLAEERLRKLQEAEEERGNRLRQILDEKNKCVKELQFKSKNDIETERRSEELEERKYYESLALEAKEEEKQRNVAKLKYGEELREMIAKNAARREKQELLRLYTEKKQQEQIKSCDEQAKRLASQIRQKKYEENQEYIHYMRRMKKFEEDQEKMRNDKIGEVHRIDTCKKSNAIEMAKKQEEKLKYIEELRDQMCIQKAKRIYEEIDRRDCKIIENTFARPENTEEVIQEQKRKLREELDKQIAELELQRAKEKELELELAENQRKEHEMCVELAKKFIDSGKSYLKPHPNWSILRPDITKESEDDICRFKGKLEGREHNSAVELAKTREELRKEDVFCLTGGSPTVHCPRFPTRTEQMPKPSTCVDQKKLNEIYEAAKCKP